jgi:transcription-repair coupling factor (superfamily II helicase)
MTHGKTILFQHLSNAIQHWSELQVGKLQVNGVDEYQWGFMFQHLRCSNAVFRENSHVIICPTFERAESLYQNLVGKISKQQLHFYPGLEFSPYQDYLPSENNLFKRLKVLDLLSQKKTPYVIILSLEAFLLKLPPRGFFQNNRLTISKEEIIPPDELVEKLVALGYTPSITIEEEGTFSRKGEILDIFPVSGVPVRLQFFDELVEAIHPIFLDTQKTNWEQELMEIACSAAPLIFTHPLYKDNLRKHIPQPTPKFWERFEKRKKVFQQLNNHQLFDGYPHFLPLFFSQSETFFDYLQNNTIFHLIDHHGTHQRLSLCL